MRCVGFTALLAALCASAMPAQRQTTKPRRPASIDGDVYLLMKSGDTKRSTSNTVYLVPNTPQLQLDMLTACQENDLRLKPFREYEKLLTDSIEAANKAFNRGLLVELQVRSVTAALRTISTGDKVVAVVRSRILSDAIDTAGTGVAGHYKFSGVPAGQYMLYAQWQIADAFYAWWAPVDVAEGQSAKRDLDNSVEDHVRIFCGTDWGLMLQRLKTATSRTPSAPDFQ